MASRIDITCGTAMAARAAVERLWFLGAADNEWESTVDRHVVSIDLPDPDACAHDLKRAVLRARVAGLDVDGIVGAARFGGDGQETRVDRDS